VDAATHFAQIVSWIIASKVVTGITFGRCPIEQIQAPDGATPPIQLFPR
jgi:hypothetical protein